MKVEHEEQPEDVLNKEFRCLFYMVGELNEPKHLARCKYSFEYRNVTTLLKRMNTMLI